MATQSLSARLRVAAGLLRGAERLASTEALPRVGEALHEHARALELLLEAVERRDRLRESAARRVDGAESRGGA
jgi:hypothetical protein